MAIGCVRDRPEVCGFHACDGTRWRGSRLESESHSRGRGFDSPRLHLRFCWVSALTAQPRPPEPLYSARSLRVPATRGVTLAADSARWALALAAARRKSSTSMM